MKIGTKGIKKLIGKWLELESIKGFYVNDGDEPLDEKKLDADFRNPKMWKRAEKFRGYDKDDAEYLGDAGDPGATFKDVFDAVTDWDRPIFRLFKHTDEQIGDNWRLEVLTTEDDSQIIAFAFIVD